MVMNLYLGKFIPSFIVVQDKITFENYFIPYLNYMKEGELFMSKAVLF